MAGNHSLLISRQYLVRVSRFRVQIRQMECLFTRILAKTGDWDKRTWIPWYRNMRNHLSAWSLFLDNVFFLDRSAPPE